MTAATLPASSTLVGDNFFFQRLGLEETFARLWHVFQQRWAVFLSITVVAYGLIWLVTLLSVIVLVLYKRRSSRYLDVALLTFE